MVHIILRITVESSEADPFCLSLFHLRDFFLLVYLNRRIEHDTFTINMINWSLSVNLSINFNLIAFVKCSQTGQTYLMPPYKSQLIHIGWSIFTHIWSIKKQRTTTGFLKWTEHFCLILHNVDSFLVLLNYYIHKYLKLDDHFHLIHW